MIACGLVNSPSRICSYFPDESSDGYHGVGVQSNLEGAELVAGTAAAGTVYLEQQGVTLTEIPGGGVQAIPTGPGFEGATGELHGVGSLVI